MAGLWNLSKESKFVRLSNAVTSGTSTITTSIFSLLGAANPGQYPPGTVTNVPGGFDAITLIVAMGAVTATGVVTVTLQDNSLNQTSGMANVAAASAQVAYSITGGSTVVQNGTACGLTLTDVGAATSNGLLVLDIALVQLQYYQVVITRTVAASALDGVFGILYRSKQRPVVQDSTVIGQGFFVASS